MFQSRTLGRVALRGPHGTLDAPPGMTYCNTWRCTMAKSKVAVSLDKNILNRLDRLVEAAVFSSRSQAVQIAVEEKLKRLECGRLARECAKLDPAFEKTLAEEGLSEELLEWPEY